MLELIRPDVRLYDSWLAAHREFVGAHQDGTGLLPSLEADDREAFEAWISDSLAQRDPRTVLEPGKVHCSYFWIAEADEYLGGISIRHRQGIATWALAEAVGKAREIGLSRVLVTCLESNEGSRRTIEANAGSYEDSRVPPEQTEAVRRYWIGT